ncbi:MAG TPA: glycosyltransferase family 2 protein [Marmoricola sp.]|nr:glycosyltransferase family 2 protein [Marmoricola sp.]
MRPRTTGVVILNYGDPADTLGCLGSLEGSTDLDLDVVVVHNGPEDDTYRRLADQIGRRADLVATGDNLGYAAGNNVGIDRVLGRDCGLVWLLNPDTVVLPDTLTVLRARLDATPDCGVVGPRLLFPGKPATIWFDGGLVDTTNAVTRHISLGVRERRAPAPQALDVDYVTGASLLVRRSVIEQVGAIPEQYFLYYEEVDWCRRIQAAGWRTITDQHARMVHAKRSSGALPMPYYLYYMTRNRFLFAEDCLGVDGEEALAQLDADFLDPWRVKVSQRAPDWLPAFDDLVARAKEDARARVYGRNDEITNYPAADEVPA